MFRPSKSHFQRWYLKNDRKYTDHVREGNLASYRFLLEVWSLHII